MSLPMHFQGSFPDVLGTTTPGIPVPMGHVTEVEVDAVTFEVTERLKARPVQERGCLIEGEGEKLKDGVKYR